jgi:hypothetical protein
MRVIAGLDPAIPINLARPCPMIGMAGSSPAMTVSNEPNVLSSTDLADLVQRNEWMPSI